MDDQLPLISVAVAVYNPNIEYFTRCIISLQNQTYSNIEILLVDDGSEQKVADVCDEFALKDPRIHVFHKKNGGLPSARNVGIDMAQGDYLVFMDSDDYVDANMVFRGYEEIVLSHAQISAWTYYSFTDRKKGECYYKGPDKVLFEGDDIWKYRALMLDAMIFDDLQFALCMTSWGKMFDMNFLRSHREIRFNEELLYGAEDNDFLHRLLLVTDRLVLFHENLYYYRDTESSKTSRFRERFVEHEFAIMQILKQDIQDDKRLEHAFDKYCCNLVLFVCICFLLHEDNPMGYIKKRKVLKEVTKQPEIRHSLHNVSSRDFPKLKYLFIVGAKYGCYDIMLLLAWGYVHLKE